MSEKRKYDSTIARMAGNIAAGLTAELIRKHDIESVAYGSIAEVSVAIARAIVAEVERTEPKV